MTTFQQKYRTDSTRLLSWDYSRTGWYFVTLCTKRFTCYFGKVVEDTVHFSPIGEIVAEEWQNTEQIRKDVSLDRWVLMPNHLHGIIVLRHWTPRSAPLEMFNRETAHRETPRRGVSTGGSRLTPNSLGSIIGQFKSICTKRIRAAGFVDFAWQSRFYDHIIRGEKALNGIREYIVNNPLKWELDQDNPKNFQG